MSGAVFVTCPGCDRLMLGERRAGDTFPQPHECEMKARVTVAEVERCQACREGVPSYIASCWCPTP